MELLGEAKWGIFSFMLEMISPGYKNGVGWNVETKKLSAYTRAPWCPVSAAWKAKDVFNSHLWAEWRLLMFSRDEPCQRDKQLILNPTSLAALVISRATNGKAGFKSFSHWPVLTWRIHKDKKYALALEIGSSIKLSIKIIYKKLNQNKRT